MTTNDKAAQFEIFLCELQKWNEKFNLTSITEEKDIRLKHFEDSLTLSQAYDFSKGSPRVADIGAGAGFPGIPLKIKYPDIRLVLIEATKKKTQFMEHIVDVLGLQDVDVIWGRAEEIVGAHRETFDVAFCRAFAPLKIAAEICLPFVKVGGEFLAMKGSNIDSELIESQKAVRVMGGKLKETLSVSIPGTDIKRKIVVISKLSESPLKYPRRMGIAKKRPL